MFCLCATNRVERQFHIEGKRADVETRIHMNDKAMDIEACSARGGKTDERVDVWADCKG